MTIYECRLAAALHLPPAAVRRMPLALLLLRSNYTAQADGLETWWANGSAARLSDAEVDARIAALRQTADDADAEGWASYEGEEWRAVEDEGL